ncbi:TIGR01777 family oxidoreductase [Virgibacillus senegalensis]|uniref:TIGR01777 family oxidoreductase n=1 Tax=Virgibacillus senegalensis TaxID=1499679 RepID=UPI00069FFDE1|nr:TIGR01777 family oxidoreductase [Virgibacillus senegalensis]
MNVAITGGTGFVGRYVTKQLVKKGHRVYVLTRNPENYRNTDSITYVGWLHEDYHPESELPALEAVVNLAGDSIFGYWTEEKKQTIMNSRLHATEEVIRILRKMPNKPRVLVNGSAMGYYGTSTEQAFTEKTQEPGDDFLAKVAANWEAAAAEAETLGVRTVYARFGLILGRQGALPLMALPFKLMMGGKVGSGEQWVSWIHIDDVVELILFAINTAEISGPLNVTSPKPQRNKDFSKTVAKVLHKPYWLPVPEKLMKPVLGDMTELVLKGQCVLPSVAQGHGYVFHYPRLEPALRDIFAT